MEELQANNRPKIRLVLGAILLCVSTVAMFLVFVSSATPRDPYRFLRGNTPFESFREFGGISTFSVRTYSFKADFAEATKQIDQELAGSIKQQKATMKLGPNQEYYTWNLPGGRMVHAKPARARKTGQPEIRPDWTLIMIVDQTPPSIFDRTKYWLKTHSPF
jgi:hypothetical protein